MREQYLLIGIFAVIAAFVYRRIILRRVRIHYCEKIINSMNAFFNAHNNNLLAEQDLDIKEVSKIIFNDPETKFELEAIELAGITLKFDSLKELRKQLSDLCLNLEDHISYLRDLYGNEAISQEYDEKLNSIKLDLRIIMCGFKESWG